MPAITLAQANEIIRHALARSRKLKTKPLGVAVVDIGAGTTDVAIYTGGSIRHTAVIPIAGDLITSDIAMALRTPTKDAEDIKVDFGVAKQLLADPNEQVEVPGLGDLPLVGGLFRSESREHKKQNLMVFLRPVVLRDHDSANKLSLDRYDIIRARQKDAQPSSSVLLRVACEASSRLRPLPQRAQRPSLVPHFAPIRP